MKTSLKTFLSELYEIDPGLRAHESEIIPLVEKLLQSDPAQEPDAAFVKRLRMQLKDRSVELGAGATSPGTFFQKVAFALGGAVTAAVIIPLVFIAMQNKDGTPVLQPGESLFGYKVEEAGDNAFGPLTGMPSAYQREGRGGGGGGSPEAMGAGDEVAANPPVVSGEAYGETDAKMIAPWPIVKYDYVYEGEFPALQSEVDVYKRTPSAKRLPLSAILEGLKLGTVDLTSFSGLSVNFISLSQNIDFGYEMSVSLREATVGIDAQWDKWPQSRCQTEACYRAERIKLTDIPADDVLIGIAKDFAADHNIDLSTYGEAEVNHLWKRDYDRTPNKDDAYIPDTMSVIFPLVIDGETVYDQGGQKMGITINVHVKHRRVMNVWGIMDRTYQKSSYAGVTDQARIKSFVSSVDNYYGDPAAIGGPGAVVTTATVKLSAPTIGYSVFYRYTQGLSEELLIPSLMFQITEVTGAPAEMWYYRSMVVVPLAQDMLDEQIKMTQPMPMEGDVRVL